MKITSYYLTKEELEELLLQIGDSYKIMFPINTKRIKESII